MLRVKEGLHLRLPGIYIHTWLSESGGGCIAYIGRKFGANDIHHSKEAIWRF